MRAADAHANAMQPGMFGSLTSSEVWELGWQLHRAWLSLFDAALAAGNSRGAAEDLRADVLDLCDQVDDLTFILLMPRPWQKWSNRRRKEALAARPGAGHLRARGGGIKNTAARRASWIATPSRRPQGDRPGAGRSAASTSYLHQRCRDLQLREVPATDQAIRDPAATGRQGT
jgi:hypothetical protein